MKHKKKVLVIETLFQPPGGGRSVTAWMLQALKSEYDVTLMTWNVVDLTKINAYYGVSLSSRDIRTIAPPFWLRNLVNAIPGDPWCYQGFGFLMRWCRIIGRQFDVLVGANNEIDFGTRGIQYFHHPYLAQTENWEGLHNHSARYRWSLRKQELRPWRVISGFSFDRMRQNLTLVNSNWTGDVVKKAYGISSTTLYPAVPGQVSNTPWDERETGFVCIGRFSHEKNYELIIEVLAKVRAQFPDIHLHIIGSSVSYDRESSVRLRELVALNRSWISIHSDISRDELELLIGRHRYGIHAMEEEHFGIAVAELIRGGCITFIPDGGGQVEIVGDAPDLRYRSKDDAVEKICGVLRKEKKQKSLCQHLDTRKNLFSQEIFVNNFATIVKDFVTLKKQ